MPMIPSGTLFRACALLTVLGSLAFVEATPAASSAPAGTPESTRRMAALLKKIAAETNPFQDPYMNGARARKMEAALAAGQAANPKLKLALAEEMLNAGRTDDAIALLDGLLAETLKTSSARGGPGPRLLGEIRVQLAIAHLRRAEEENCSMHHNPRSCILPIRGAGVHTKPRGARAAAEILGEVLTREPDKLRARWLLNLASMTLGEWPDGVPDRWVLPPKVFASEHDVGSFPDVAASAGVDVDDLAGGSIVDDLDGDGYLDIMVSAMGLDSPLRYFRNERDGTFAERTAEAGLTGLVDGLNMVSTDYDNDGDIDVLVLRGGWRHEGGRYPNSLLRNDGEGTFRDVTEEAGLLSSHPTQTATWLDYDGDGWLDVYIGNESTKQDRHPNELYRNNRDGTFTECASEAGVAAVGYVKAVTSGDFNNDGRPDIYVSVLDGANLLYRNDGPPSSPAGAGARRPCGWRFSEVAAAAGVTAPIMSFPAWFWDYDNDGWEDLFVSGYRIGDVGDAAADYLGLPHRGELPRLYRNKGDGTFADVTKQAHLDHLLLTMGSNYGDFDNDGWLDFYAGTGNPHLGMLMPNRAFRNDEGRLFQDITTSADLGHLQKGHGVSFADLDNDGDQDVHHVVGGAYETDRFRNALFRNPGHGNHWIVLALEGSKSNRPAIGARIKVIVTAPSGERTIYRTVRTGGSFGASPLRQEIGLGKASAIRRVEIRWPSGGPPRVIEGLAMDRRYVIREAGGDPVPLTLKAFTLGGAGRIGTAASAGGSERN